MQSFVQGLLEKTRYDATFIASLHRICFQSSRIGGDGDDGDQSTASSSSSDDNQSSELDFHMPPLLIGDTSFKSLNFHTGIMILEKQILKVNTRIIH